MLRFNGTKVPPEYEARFQMALWAFRHARVYCTTEKVRCTCRAWQHLITSPVFRVTHVSCASFQRWRMPASVLACLFYACTVETPCRKTMDQLILTCVRFCAGLIHLQALIHLAPLPGGGIGTADVDIPAAVTQLEQQQQDQKLDFLGPMLPPDVARGIAEGVFLAAAPC